MFIIWYFSWWCPWCNGYGRRKWTRRYEFKSWTRLIAFHMALIPLGKVWIQLFSLQLNVPTVLFQTIQSSKTHLFALSKCQISLFDLEIEPFQVLLLRGGRLDLRMIEMKTVLSISQSFSITGASQSDCYLVGCLTPWKRCTQCILQPPNGVTL